MWENIIIWSAIVIAAFYMGRRLFRQWRAAVTPGKNISCNSGCSCCSSSGCDDKKQFKPGV